MGKLKNGYIFFVLLFWPISLFLSNNSSEFWLAFIPAILLSLSYFFYKRSFLVSNLFILIISFFSVKLVLFPLFYFLLSFCIKPSKLKFIFVILSLCVFLFNFNNFKGQTVFQKDYEKEQQIVRDSQLYGSVFIARAFHNKARIPLEKIENNFFSLIDPNNYFFSFHPRESISNQNLQKFPFLSVFFFLIGICFLKKHLKCDFIVLSLTALVASLSLLLNYDRSDIVLWFPFSLIIIHGIKTFKTDSFLTNTFTFLCVLFACIESIRILLKI